jgi:hypothetical protein
MAAVVRRVVNRMQDYVLAAHRAIPSIRGTSALLCWITTGLFAIRCRIVGNRRFANPIES